MRRWPAAGPVISISVLRAEMRRLLRERVHLIWEDVDVVLQWSNFLSRLFGHRPLDLPEFVRRSEKLAGREEELLALARQREKNRRAFDEANKHRLGVDYVSEAEDPVEHIMGRGMRELMAF